MKFHLNRGWKQFQCSRSLQLGYASAKIMDFSGGTISTAVNDGCLNGSVLQGTFPNLGQSEIILML